jgi:branched-chain amino acid transport system permease protein
MEIFLQQLINGVTLGSIYGLIAIGYTMVFGIIGMVNFAHGDVFMLSAFIALLLLLLLTQVLGLPAGLAFVPVLFGAMCLTTSPSRLCSIISSRSRPAAPMMSPCPTSRS